MIHGSIDNCKRCDFLISHYGNCPSCGTLNKPPVMK